MRCINSLAQLGPLSLGQLVDLLGQSGHAAVILLFSIPFLQPIPLVGLSTPVGLCMIVIGLFWCAGKPALLPRRMAGVPLPGSALIKITAGFESLARQWERFIRPRPGFFNRSRFMHRLHGLMIVIQAGLLALPLPIPFSNSLPAWTIALICLGVIEEDSLVIALGHIVGVVSLSFFFASLVILPYYGIQFLNS